MTRETSSCVCTPHARGILGTLCFFDLGVGLRRSSSQERSIFRRLCIMRASEPKSLAETHIDAVEGGVHIRRVEQRVEQGLIYATTNYMIPQSLKDMESTPSFFGRPHTRRTKWHG